MAPEGNDEEDEHEEYFAPTTAGEGVQFWPWVNKVRKNPQFHVSN